MTGSDFYWTFDTDSNGALVKYHYEVKAYRYEDRQAEVIATDSGCRDMNGYTSFSDAQPYFETSQIIETSQSSTETSQSSTSTLSQNSVSDDASFTQLDSRPSKLNRGKCSRELWNSGTNHVYLSVTFEGTPPTKKWVEIRDDTFDTTNMAYVLWCVSPAVATRRGILR